jgi:hypothetical protein
LPAAKRKEVKVQGRTAIAFQKPVHNSLVSTMELLLFFSLHENNKHAVTNQGGALWSMMHMIVCRMEPSKYSIRIFCYFVKLRLIIHLLKKIKLLYILL